MTTNTKFTATHAVVPKSPVSQRWFVLVILFASWSGTNCSLQPQQGQFLCVDVSDCPPNWSCDTEMGRCYSPSHDSSTESTTDSYSSDSESETTTTDTELDTSTNTSIDTDVDTDSDTSTATNMDTGTVPDTETETETGTDFRNTPCFRARALDPNFPCCFRPPTSCNPSTWPGASNPFSGCCSADLTTAYSCENQKLTRQSCSITCGSGSLNRAACLGNSCQDPFYVLSSPYNWSGSWSDFGSTFAPSDQSCGTGNADIWFHLLVPPDTTVDIKETTASNVTIRVVRDCEQTTCIDYIENPEEYTGTNNTGTPRSIYIVLSAAADNSVDQLAVEIVAP